MSLNKTAALDAIRNRIAKPLGMDDIEAASGIYRIANSHMSDLIRKATIEKGHDPRSFVLFAFGGAGPVHAGDTLRNLASRRSLFRSRPRFMEPRA